jgi:hypothetical protein
VELATSVKDPKVDEIALSSYMRKLVISPSAQKSALFIKVKEHRKSLDKILKLII